MSNRVVDLSRKEVMSPHGKSETPRAEREQRRVVLEKPTMIMIVVLSFSVWVKVLRLGGPVWGNFYNFHAW